MKIKCLMTFLLCIIQSYALADDSAYEKQVLIIKKNSEILAEALKNNHHKIQGIEFISANGAEDSPMMSKFGHSLLRFVDGDGQYANDIVLSFEADIDSPNIEVSKGIFGGYPIMPRFDLLNNFWKRYVEQEDRPLYRYIIPTTPQMRESLINELYRVHQNPALLDDYTFFNRNCAGVMANVLHNAGIASSYKGLDGRVPSRFHNWLESNFLSPHKEIKSISPFTLYKKIKELTGQESTDNFTNWTLADVEILRENLSSKEILFFYHEKYMLPRFLSKELIQGINHKSIDFFETIGMNLIPYSIYQICEDANCIQEGLDFEKQIWGEKTHRKISKRRLNDFKRRMFFKSGNHKNGYRYRYKRSAFKENKYRESYLKQMSLFLEAQTNCTQKELKRRIQYCSIQ